MPTSPPGLKHGSIRNADQTLRDRWRHVFAALPPEALDALATALLALRADAHERSELQWARRKAPLACYWRVVAVYAGHFARAVRSARNETRARPEPRPAAPPHVAAMQQPLFEPSCNAPPPSTEG